MVLWQETEVWDLHFHAKGGICVLGAFLMADERMHTDLFSCRLKTAMVSDSKAFFHRSIRHVGLGTLNRIKKQAEANIEGCVC